jgi:hypothetical protein
MQLLFAKTVQFMRGLSPDVTKSVFKDLLLKELDMFEELQRFGLRKKLVTGTTRIPRRASGYEREPDRYGSSSSLESPENQI